MQNNNTLTQILYDHYKDTFEQIKGYLVKRNRTTIAIIIILSIIAFFMVDANECMKILSNLLEKHVGLSNISLSILNTTTLFLLLYFIFWYYQICLLIEKSYIYLHNIENSLSQMIMFNIDRESGSYLSNYPAVSNIAHNFYTFGLPIVIIIVSIYKSLLEWPTRVYTIETLNLLLLLLITFVSIIYIFDRVLLKCHISWQGVFCRLMIKIRKMKIFFRILAVLLIVVAIIGWAFFLAWLFNGVFDSSSGNIGDTLGGTTAPFIGLISVILLYWTLKEQQSFNERQQRANEAQTQLIRDEQFKSTFFMLLQEQRDILKSLQAIYPTLDSSTTKIKTHKVTGQDFFSMSIYEMRLIFDAMDMPTYQNKYDTEEAQLILESVYDKLYTGTNLPIELKEENEDAIKGAKQINKQKYIINKYKITREEFNNYKQLQMKDKIKFVYAKFFTEYENCGYYFRHLYRILKFIFTYEKEDIESNMLPIELVQEKYFQFAQIVQSQMSQREMLITYYNSILFSNAKDLIIKYKLLENLSIESLIDENHSCYAKEYNMKHRIAMQ